MLNEIQYERYSRHILLPEIGETGQQKLLAAKILVIGAGGLGCPVLQYLTAAGAGTIGIADDDVVSLSNLQRQIIYTVDDIGKLKATTAAQKLNRLNPEVKCILFETRITNANAWDIINRFDVVIDGSDNFSTRYLVNDVCVLLNKPLVSGSIFRFEGQVAVFNYKSSANYRDLFEAPSNSDTPGCSETGVLGILPGIIGSMMANETIKIITGIGIPLANKLLNYNALTNDLYEIGITKDDGKNKLIPADRSCFEKMNYDLSCSADGITEVGTGEFNSLITLNDAVIMDVREQDEQPYITEFRHLKIPLSEMKKKPSVFNDETIVLFCQSGSRSKEAAAIIKTNNQQLTKIYSLKGGILQWKAEQLKQPQ